MQGDILDALVVDYLAEEVKRLFLSFLTNFFVETNHTDESNDKNNENDDHSVDLAFPSLKNNQIFVYVKQAENLHINQTSALFIDFQHIIDYSDELSIAIQSQYYRWKPYLHKAVYEFVSSCTSHFNIIKGPDINNTLGKDLEYYANFYNLPIVSSIRQLRSKNIGQLVSFSGTVTRTSEIRPELIYGTFRCLLCGNIMNFIEQQYKYTEPTKCLNPLCINQNEWELVYNQSLFCDWQKIKIQENSNEIPAGSMPRSIEVILRHENVDQAKAGDRVVLTGCLIVVPDITQINSNKNSRLNNPLSTETGKIVSSKINNGNNKNNINKEDGGIRGLKCLGVKELSYKLCFLACSVQTSEQRFRRISVRSSQDDEIMEDGAISMDDFSREEIHNIMKIKDDKDKYSKMAKILCKNVYGHDEIRRGILLMLFGGVHKTTNDRIKLRGDINICIVGDPSTAKSQFLKYVCRFLPRAIYTSGKVSSASGLTASVSRDVETGEYCVEAGALMLADNGICCIDEFDKMESHDQVAIHEAMEQQTITLTKAGIHATLNARTSILAAANPYNGRYDRQKTLKYNVNISAPIMSRFDLFFVIIDECDEASDLKIAEHIVSLHRPIDPEESDIYINEDNELYTEENLQRYIKYARSFRPIISPEAKVQMVRCYCKLRENDVSSNNGQSNIAYRITVRQLESMIRLSEALARLELSDEVLSHHVYEAYRLLSTSIIRVEADEIRLENTNELNQEQPEEDINIQEPENEINEIESIDTNTKVPEESLSIEKYSTIKRMLAKYIREKDLEDNKILIENDDIDNGIGVGLIQGNIISWYLSTLDIYDEKTLRKEKQKISKIIDQLIEENFLIVVEYEDEIEKENINIKNDNRYLSVHPNYDVDKL